MPTPGKKTKKSSVSRGILMGGREGNGVCCVIGWVDVGTCIYKKKQKVVCVLRGILMGAESMLCNRMGRCLELAHEYGGDLLEFMRKKSTENCRKKYFWSNDLMRKGHGVHSS
jgi:hypothetical protein